MKHILNFTYKSIFLLGILCYGWILTIDLFFSHTKYVCQNKHALSNIILLIIGLLLITIIAILIKRLPDQIKTLAEKWNQHIKRISILLLIVELIISYCIMFASGWDAGIVLGQADLIASGSTKLNHNYYSWYPNNLLITFLYSLAYRLTGLFGIQSAGSVIIVLVQCILSVLTGYYLYRIAEHMFQSQTLAMLLWILYALWLGLLPWYTVTYSEPLAIFFPVSILYLYQCMENQKKYYRNTALIGILSVIGFKLKPSTLIVSMAIFIILVLQLLDKKTRNISLKKIVIMLVTFSVTLGIFEQIDFAKQMGLKLDSNKEMPMTHFAMMGLSEKRNGIFDQKELDYSLSFPNVQQRKEANLKMIRKRLQAYGFSGLMKHMTKKTLTNYNDGAFSWGKEGDFFLIEIEKPDGPLSKAIKNIYYNDRTCRIEFNTYMQMFLIITLFGGLLHAFFLLQKRIPTDSDLIILLSLIGLFLFVSIFEARARYIYTYVPFYLLMGIGGYKQLRIFSIRAAHQPSSPHIM